MPTQKLLRTVLIASAVTLAVIAGPGLAASAAREASPVSDIGAASAILGSAASAGGGPIGKPFPISNVPAYDTRRPSVAYNSQRGEYLVVWWNDRPVNDEIQGQRVSSRGERISDPFFIAAGPGGTRRWPDVAYNSQHDEYLVVWETDWDVQAQLVSGLGGTVGLTCTIAAGGFGVGSHGQAAVAYASTADRYVVVFRSVSPAPLAHAITFNVREPDLSLVAQDPVAVYSTTTLPEKPDLAYNRTRNELLVVWQQWMGDNYDVYGRRLRMAGPGGPGPMGAEFRISQYGNDETSPAVAAIPRPIGVGQYLVVYELAVCGARAIEGWRIDGNGNLQGNEIGISEACLIPPQDCSDPAVAASEGANRYLVPWTHQYPASVGIRGAVVPREGPLLSDPAPIGGLSAANGAVASGPLGDFLVAFDDLEASKRKVFGVLWGARVYLPLVTRNH